MSLYSRLPLEDVQIRNLVEDDVPSIYAKVQLRSGDAFELHGLHPKPPAPQESEDTTERDAELLIVGKEVARHKDPAIVAGDLNDVAWSYTTRLFQEISGLLDPRVGRGMFNTFSAKNAFMRFPLDHVFHSDHFRLRRMERLEAFGSDHFPVYVELSFEPEGQGHQAEPDAEPEDQQEADEKIGNARREADSE
jgi:endonuclease/exonuclease/phosphatase (EEP) superfamily protein YafD